MGTLRFKLTENLRGIVAHAKANACAEPYTGQPAEGPGLLLVCDHGVYLMSAARERQMRSDGKGCVVAYAEGLDPHQAEPMAVWDKAHALLGGDDFAEYLPLDMFAKAFDTAGVKAFEIVVTPTAMRVRYKLP